MAEDDRSTRRLAAAQLVNAKLATRVEVARVFGLHVNTVSRIAQQVAAQAALAFLPMTTVDEDGRSVGAGAIMSSCNCRAECGERCR